MHPIWFAAWVWEKAWSEDGLLPLIEHNQGALSLAALGLALAAFLIENARANRAKAEAVEAERQRQEAAQAAEADRRQYELEMQRRDAERTRTENRDRQLQHMARFVSAANGIILKVENALTDESNAALASNSAGVITLFPSAETRKVATVAAQSLIAIIPAAPMEPGLITDVRRAAFELDWLGGEGHGVYRAEEAVKYLREQVEKLIKARENLTEHNIALTAQLRPPLPDHFQIDLFNEAPASF
jgi:hypothetical protein